MLINVVVRNLFVAHHPGERRETACSTGRSRISGLGPVQLLYTEWAIIIGSVHVFPADDGAAAVRPRSARSIRPWRKPR